MADKSSLKDIPKKRELKYLINDKIDFVRSLKVSLNLIIKIGNIAT